MGTIANGGSSSRGGQRATGGTVQIATGGVVRTGGSVGGGTGGRSSTGGVTSASGGSSLGSGGAGGRTGGTTTTRDAGLSKPTDNPGCLSDIVANDYACGAAKPCSQCLDNTTSLEDKCVTMVDCLQAKGATASPSSNAWLECLNKSGGSGVLDGCVKSLYTAACSGTGCGEGPPAGLDAAVASPDSATVDAPAVDTHPADPDARSPSSD
jgi:hypothetical protein